MSGRTRPRFRSFLHDREAVASLGAVVGVLALILVPILLFVLLWRYLRQVAPEGTVPEAAAETTGPAAPAPAEEEEVPTQVTCSRCGVRVRPSIKGYESAECPNCGAPLFVTMKLPVRR